MRNTEATGGVPSVGTASDPHLIGVKAQKS